MKVELLLFASLADLVGDDQIEIEVEPDETATQFLSRIERSVPALAGKLGSVRVAADHQFRAADEPVLPAQELALIPPVSGG